MRRDRAAENGVTEFMVAALMGAAPRLGVERVSLNFAVFRSVFERGRPDRRRPDASGCGGTRCCSSPAWWQLESLYRSNAKYQPHWTPRYLCFAERRELARVGLAAAVAEGFVALPGGAAHPAARRCRRPAAAVRLRAAGRRDGPGRCRRCRPRRGLPEQIRVRLAKLDRLRAEGVDPYPVGYPRTDGCAAVRERYAGLAPDTGTGETVAVAGRVMLVRDHGQLCFATIRDGSGDLQLMLDARPGPLAWTAVDLGDHVGRHRRGVRHAARRAVGAGGRLAAHRQVPAPAAGQAPRAWPTRRPGSGSATSTSSSTRTARELLRARGAAVRSLRQTLAGRGLPGGGDADPAAGARRRERPPVRHPHQRLRPAAVPAHRPRAVPQAAGRGRGGAGVRAGPGLPQRGRRPHPQPRVHDAGGVPGVRRLPRDA